MLVGGWNMMEQTSTRWNKVEQRWNKVEQRWNKVEQRWNSQLPIRI